MAEVLVNKVNHFGLIFLSNGVGMKSLMMFSITNLNYEKE